MSWGHQLITVLSDAINATAFLTQDMAGHWKRPRSASSLMGITGTVLWAALSVLEGEQHSLSSMLEGLFISALSIS